MGNTTLVIGLVIGAILLIGAITVLDYVGRTADVVTKEIDPAVIQQKYVWFQNQKAAIDNSDANIRSQINAAKAKKSIQNYSEWDRFDKQSYQRSIDDIMGIIALRNGLIRDYNSAMSQWQMGFANMGSWPKGAKYQSEDFNAFPNSYPEYSYGDELIGI